MAGKIDVTPAGDLVPQQQMRNIAKEVAREELNKVSNSIREEFLLVFGLFAAILTFLSIEVQVFAHAPRFPLIVGLSLFMLGSLQMFVLSLYNIIKNKNDFKKDYKNNPIFWFVVVCYASAIISFVVGKY